MELRLSMAQSLNLFISISNSTSRPSLHSTNAVPCFALTRNPKRTSLCVKAYGTSDPNYPSLLTSAVIPQLSGKEWWRRVLEDYLNAHPELTVLDPPGAIQQVYNRQFMLQNVADLNLSDVYGKVGVSKQLVIKKDPSSIPGAVNKAVLRLRIGPNLNDLFGRQSGTIPGYSYSAANKTWPSHGKKRLYDYLLNHKNVQFLMHKIIS